MNPSNKPKEPSSDHSFSTFVLGITLGVLGAVLLGTQEGKDFVQKTLNSLSNDSDTDPNLIKKIKSSIKPETKTSSPKDRTSDNYPSQEPPPPPPPVLHRSPRYFRNDTGDQLKSSL